MPTRSFTLPDGTSLTLAVETLPDGAYRLTTEGQSVDFTPTGPGVLNLDGKQVRFYSHQHNETLSLWVNGQVYTFGIPATPGARRGKAGGSSVAQSTGHVLAPMPGTVLKLHVAAGEAVTAHQPLVVMESMKMELTLTAPCAGTVAEVACAVGQMVEMNLLLVRLEL